MFEHTGLTADVILVTIDRLSQKACKSQVKVGLKLGEPVDNIHGYLA